MKAFERCMGGCFAGTLCMWLSVFGMPVPAMADDADSPPNFVVIFIDDMGYGDIGPFGSAKNSTPNLDRMAREGMKLTSFYAAPVCSASRAQLLTGSYAPRVSVPGVFSPAGDKGLNPDEHTIADYLGELGYATACIGKWHLGDQPEFLPTRQGFDRYFGIPYSNDMQRKTLDDGRSVVPLLRDEKVEKLLENKDQRQIVRRYTEESIAFLEQQATAEKPFFLYLPHTAMHVPIFPHPDFLGKSSNGQYGDWVMEVDWSVGQVLDALKRLELEKNTLVLFTSDNGPWASKGSDGGEAGLLRGSKGSTWEGGVREPTLARWPGKISPGTNNDAVTGTTDLLPTLVSLAGGKPKADRKIDGHDISPILLGASEEIEGRIWHYYRGTRLEAIRRGPWKLDLVEKESGMGMEKTVKSLPDKEKKAPFRPHLYNLDTDIGESTDLAADHPEVVAELQQLADAMIADIGSGSAGPGVRPAGSVKNPVTLYATEPRDKKATSSTPAVVPARSMAPIEWMTVSAGKSYSTFSAPEIAGKGFTIEATLTPTSSKANGVIISHGGSQVGYSLHLNNGHAEFAVRTFADRLSQVASTSPIEGKTSIRARLTSEGMLILKAGDQTETKTEAHALIGKHPQEDLCVGHDAKNTVVAHGEAGDKLQAELHNLTVEVDP